MRLSRLLASAGSATLFLGAGLLWGQDAAPAPPPAPADVPLPALAPPSHEARPLTPQEQAILEKYDTNGDGKLEPDEVAAAHGAAQPQNRGRAVKGPPGKQLYLRLLAHFARERTGSLTPAEQAQAVDYLAASAPAVYRRVLERFDQNGDGRLDPAEIATMFATLATLSGMPPRTAAAN
jgi:EF hand domain-containing protein